MSIGDVAVPFDLYILIRSSGLLPTTLPPVLPRNLVIGAGNLVELHELPARKVGPIGVHVAKIVVEDFHAGRRERVNAAVEVGEGVPVLPAADGDVRRAFNTSAKPVATDEGRIDHTDVRGVGDV